MGVTKSAKKNNTFNTRSIIHSPRNSPAPETPRAAISIKGIAPSQTTEIEGDMNGSGKREREIAAGPAETITKRRKKPRKPKPPKAGITFEADEPATFTTEMDDLFIMDSTPSIVPIESVYVDAALLSPTRGTESAETIELARLSKEEEEMRIFAEEVAMDGSSDEDDEDEEEEEEEEEESMKAEVVSMKIYDDPKKLEEAIQGKITDDSAAKVTGRYYKEIDLTRSCALCGEQGHTSRECTHSQCFTCGEVDGDHEARNCPVTLVCLSCGSRGHVSRECTVTSGGRSSYGTRCATCSSGLHAASNCPSLWRVYNTTGAQPKKARLVYACANDGSTDNHFIDDCLLPRMHPIRSCDPSAFNAAAAGQTVSKRPTNGGAERRRNEERMEAEDEDETDWFASRTVPGKNRNGSNRDSGAKKADNRFAPPSRDSPSHSRFGGGGGSNSSSGAMSYRGGGKFSASRSRDSPRDYASSNSAPRSRQRSPPPHQNRETLNYFPEESKYRGSAASNRSGGNARDDRRNAGSGYNDSREGTPSLASRMDSGRKKGPSYRGGYY